MCNLCVPSHHIISSLSVKSQLGGLPGLTGGGVAGEGAGWQAGGCAGGHSFSGSHVPKAFWEPSRCDHYLGLVVVPLGERRHTFYCVVMGE